MKIVQKALVAMALALAMLTMPSFAQQTGKDGKDSASLETLREDFLKLGKDLKLTASEAQDLVAQWLSSTGTNLGNKASAATTQTKLGVVMETNKANLTVTIVDSDGNTSTFSATEETPILIQDAVAGLQTPFSGGKATKFKNIKKGDWVNYSYSLKDAIQQILPSSTAGLVQAQAIDILR